MAYVEERRGSHLRVESLVEYRRARGITTTEQATAPTGIRLSVAMAAHNEERTIGRAISDVLAVSGDFALELIVVDDGSTDGTLRIARSFDDPRLTVLTHPTCRGKGASILEAASVASGTHILLFDADLEYSADDIPRLVEPVASGDAHVVYGARVRGERTMFPSLTYALGSKATTVFTNVIFNSWMTDMHTCLKLVPLALFREMSLSQTGFGLDTEITGEILRRGVRPYEVPCSYHGRSVAEGKKISARDGVECLKVAVQVRMRGRIAADLPTGGSAASLPVHAGLAERRRGAGELAAVAAGSEAR
ncbi:MAG: glycosyltransferase family 2 protein [Actinomycetota bacterium]|nr:glycosyltransferase family 2 protein [Actinomycetota bacterium]